MNSQAIFLVMLFGLAAAVFYIDLRRQIIPDVVNGALMLVGSGSIAVGNQPGLWNAVWGAVAGLVVMLAVQQSYRAYRGVDGLGGGDVKFMAAAGLWVGLAGLPWLMLLASLSGLLAFAVMAVLGRAQAMTRLPFGPHLAFSLVLTWLALQRGFL